jgi:molybdate transport system substrate-binding protein
VIPGRRCGAAALVALALVAGAAACGDDGDDVAIDRSSRRIDVYAAASLTEAFTEAAESADSRGLMRVGGDVVDPRFSFAGSGALVAQLQHGARADVIATADPASMEVLVDGGLVEDPVVFARNRLAILVAEGNPEGIAGLADLTRSDLRIVLADETVPAGRYAAEALARAGVTVEPRSRELDVKAAVARVTSGEADATVVYVTDVVAAGDRADGVDIPDEVNVSATYPIAVLKETDDREAAHAFVDWVVSGPGQAALRDHGFLAPR